MFSLLFFFRENGEEKSKKSVECSIVLSGCFLRNDNFLRKKNKYSISGKYIIKKDL